VPGQHFDNDHNGFANDIAGWNFFDKQQRPRPTCRATSPRITHGTGRALDAAEQGQRRPTAR